MSENLSVTAIGRRGMGRRGRLLASFTGISRPEKLLRSADAGSSTSRRQDRLSTRLLDKLSWFKQVGCRSNDRNYICETPDIRSPRRAYRSADGTWRVLLLKGGLGAGKTLLTRRPKCPRFTSMKSRARASHWSIYIERRRRRLSH